MPCHTWPTELCPHLTDIGGTRPWGHGAGVIAQSELADILNHCAGIEPPALFQTYRSHRRSGATDRGFSFIRRQDLQAPVELRALALSTSQDVLFAIADGMGPAKSLIALGYAGWEAGQLEAEMADNAWLTCPYDADILFNTSSELRLEAAARHLGINLNLLTSQAGHA